MNGEVMKFKNCCNHAYAGSVFAPIIKIAADGGEFDAIAAKILELLCSVSWLSSAEVCKGEVYIANPIRQLDLICRRPSIDIDEADYQIDPVVQKFCMDVEEGSEVGFFDDLLYGNCIIPFWSRQKLMGAIVLNVPPTIESDENCYQLLLAIGDIMSVIAHKNECDIDRIFLQKALNESIYDLERFEAGISHHAVMSVLDENREFVHISSSLCELTGYRYDELIGEKWNKIESGGRSNSELFNFYRTLKSGEVWTGKVNLRNKDGVVARMNSSVIPTKNLRNEKQYVALMTDFSEKKTSEKMLRESQTFLQGITNALGDGVLVFDPDGTITYANMEAQELLGIDELEMLGQTFREAVSFPLVSNHFKMSRNITNGNSADIFKVLHGEETFIDNDGRVFPVSYTITPMAHDKGVFGTVMVFRDITKRKKAENTIKKSQSFLQGVANALGDGVIVQDSNRRVMYMNPEAQFMLDWEEFDAMGMTLHDIVHGKNCSDHSFEDCVFGNVLKDLHILRNEDVFLRRDGSSFPVSYVATPMIEDEGIFGLVTVFRDITQQKNFQTEQNDLISKLKEAKHQLFQAEKMASIGQLAAGVAHEINNPMGYVYSNIQTLDSYVEGLVALLRLFDDIVEKNNTGVEYDFSQVEDLKKELEYDFIINDIASLVVESKYGVNRVRDIVKDLKDFSRVDSAEWHWANLHEGLDATLNIVYNELKYKANIKKEYGEIPEILCLAPKLNQVFLNVLMNAAHSIEDRGVITISTGLLDRDHIVIEISDTGVGIPEEKISKIFDPFYTTKPVGEGTGLGLSLSYSIIQQHSGEMDVESVVGKGTVFRIVLPIEHEREK